MPLRLTYSISREKWIHLCVSGPFCYWTPSENTSKYQDHISQPAFFSKVRVVPKLTKKPTAQQNSFFFLFSGLVSSLITSAVCVVNPFCVWSLLVPIKPALKLLSPSPTFQRGSNGHRQWECLAAAAHIPAAASFKPLQQKWLWDSTYPMKPSWQKLDDFSLRLKGICLSWLCSSHYPTVEHHQTSSTAPFFAERRGHIFFSFL